MRRCQLKGNLAGYSIIFHTFSLKMLSRTGILTGQSKSLVALTSRCVTTTTACSTDRPESSKPAIPRLIRSEPGKVRMGFIPEEWFTFFYKKTGVTGPYAFGLGFGTYLISKEWYVMDHEYYNGLSMLLLCIIAVKKLGPPLAKYLDKEIDEYEGAWNACRENEKQIYVDQIKNEEQMQWSSEGQLTLLDAKRENVHMQLEAEYRQRMMTVYQQVKLRLDYHNERENVERRISQKNLVSWVVKQVMGSITTEQEKQNIDKCISDLALLAKA